MYAGCIRDLKIRDVPDFRGAADWTANLLAGRLDFAPGSALRMDQIVVHDLNFCSIMRPKGALECASLLAI
jgi:hypothetical protein